MARRLISDELYALQSMLNNSYVASYEGIHSDSHALIAADADHPFFNPTSSSTGECKICYEDASLFGFLHCNLADVHDGFCGSCVHAVNWATLGCPICAQPVLRPIKIFT